MKKILLSFFAGVLMVTASAQTVTINTAPTSTTQLNGLGSSNYHVSEYIYTNTELGNTSFTTAGTAINQINLNMTALSDLGPLTLNNVKIYLKEVPSSTTTFTAGTYSTAGYTEVFNGSFPCTTVGWTGVNLTTPFTRTAGNNLQMMIERTDNVVPTNNTTGPPTWQSTPNVANSSRRYNGAAALTAATSLGLSAHRVCIQFKHAVANDATLNSFTSIGKLPVGYASTSPVTASVSNTGTAALTNVIVTLNVTGANTYTGTKTIASLASGATTSVSFDGYVPTATGTNTLAVSVAADGDNTNNTVPNQTQITTASTYALSNDDAFTPGGSIGFNTGSGNLLVKMPVYKNNNLTSVRVSLSSEAAVAGNTVYGVVLSSTGTILSQSPNYVVQNTDLGTYVTFTFPAPVAVTAGTTYYIGLGQTANTVTGYYPVNTQSSKTNLAHSTVLAGGTITDYATFGSLMIEGVFASVFPVNLVSFTGSVQGNENSLRWITKTESNNKGFELQRSVDGKNFTSIAVIASKAEGGSSATELSYSYNDKSPIAGTNYYRLKQIDKDGKINYSSIVELKNGKNRFEISSVYPNPAKETINLSITSGVSEKATISLTDLNGRIVKQLNVALNAGDNYININVNALAPGSYIVRLVNSQSEIKTAQFIKQ